LDAIGITVFYLVLVTETDTTSTVFSLVGSDSSLQCHTWVGAWGTVPRRTLKKSQAESAIYVTMVNAWEEEGHDQIAIVKNLSCDGSQDAPKTTT
jgi:hypothetical protein